MSRLVVNKSEERTICVIRNFITIELCKEELKIIDESGLKTFNVFSLSDSLWGDSLKFRSSTSYSHWQDQYTLAPVVWDNICEIITEHQKKQLQKCIDDKVLKLSDLEINMQNKDQHIINISESRIEDKFDMRLSIFGKNSYAITGNDNYIYLNPTDYANAKEFGIIRPHFYYYNMPIEELLTLYTFTNAVLDTKS